MVVKVLGYFYIVFLYMLLLGCLYFFNSSVRFLIFVKFLKFKLNDFSKVWFMMVYYLVFFFWSCMYFCLKYFNADYSEYYNYVNMLSLVYMMSVFYTFIYIFNFDKLWLI